MLQNEPASARRKPSVFIVEDEALVALNLEDMLMELGFEIAGQAMRLDAALRQVEGGVGAGVAILDVNLAGTPVFPVAEKLVERGIPIVFATGYGRAGLPDEWRDRPVLQKPYTLEEVATVLGQIEAA